MVTRKKLEEMFAHYIDRKRCNQAHPSDSQDGLWSAGECNEAAKWLSMFGVDLSYETVQPMMKKPHANLVPTDVARGLVRAGRNPACLFFCTGSPFPIRGLFLVFTFVFHGPLPFNVRFYVFQ